MCTGFTHKNDCQTGIKYKVYYDNCVLVENFDTESDNMFDCVWYVRKSKEYSNKSLLNLIFINV